jgi:hypothetical protein
MFAYPEPKQMHSCTCSLDKYCSPSQMSERKQVTDQLTLCNKNKCYKQLEYSKMHDIMSFILWATCVAFSEQLHHLPSIAFKIKH